MRRRRILALVTALVLLVGADLWVRKTFGVFLPWQIPGRIDVCGRRYHPAERLLPTSPDTLVVRIDATVFALPIPLPDLQPTNGRLPFAGCPFQLALVLKDRVIPYGPPEGGP